MTTADSSGAAPRTSFAQRIAGSFLLNSRVFEDIERDPSALIQATLVVVAAGMARGIGAFGTEGMAGLIGSPAVGVATWLVAGSIIWAVGVKRFGCSSDLPELLRTLGFAAAPLLLLALGALPLGEAHSSLWIAAHSWAAIALVVAVREALDVSTRGALAACVFAIAVGFVLLALLGLFVAEWGAFD